MKPLWVGDELCYLICSLGNSTLKKVGNLRMYYKDGLRYKEYSPDSKRWGEERKKKSLSEYEGAILMLAGQGKSSQEISGYLCKDEETIRNCKKMLFAKLNVLSQGAATEVAFHEGIIHPKRERTVPKQVSVVEAPYKKRRMLITKDMLQRIQQHLDDGMSIRQAAKQIGVSESAIRYLINKGSLKR
jgi:DNA-binding CsgD family transcriptional regulator